VHPARAARLRPAAQSNFLKKILHLHRHASHVVPFDAGYRIEIDPQLVGVIEITRAHGVRMQLDAAEIHDPREAGRVVDDNSSAVRPDGKESVTVLSHSGRLSGARFW